eukprot:TRINITY_DN110295_c0_g1_i1.p1 TRINITY_DN110295_c0_g1~~TRINITY_DN110295_c0_g1_i1.p1  ORF type:complete len:389 (+),score=84.46 TRINITY_DN110295_c0_g1_i1:40-1167(+)
MQLALCPAPPRRRGGLRLRLELLESGEDSLRRKVLLPVPPSLDHVADLVHHINSHFRLQPQPLVLSVEGFTLLPAQRLEDVLRDGDWVLVRPSRQRWISAKRRRALITSPSQDACVPIAAPPAAPMLALPSGSGKGCRSRPRTASAPMLALPGPEAVRPPEQSPHLQGTAQVLPDASASDLWKPIARSPLPGEVLRFRLRGCDGLTCFQAARCVAAMTLDGSSQVTLQGEGMSAPWSTPLDSLLQVSVFKAEAPEPQAAKQTCSKVLEQEKVARQEVAAAAEKVVEKMDAKKIEKLRCATRRQFDFYFGDANYAKDNFLRRQADEEGWTSFRLVSKFNRVRELTTDLEFIRSCMVTSDVVELSECGEYIRRKSVE